MENGVFAHTSASDLGCIRNAKTRDECSATILVYRVQEYQTKYLFTHGYPVR